MTDHEIPREGGSYLRQADGSLKRVDDGAPAEAPAPAPVESKQSPQARPRKAKE